MRNKIKRKLYLGFAVVLAITVIISAFGLVNIRSVSENYEYAFSYPAERLDALTQISVRMLDSDGLVPTIALESGNTEAINRLTLSTTRNHGLLLDYARDFRDNVHADSRLDAPETASLIQLMNQTEELFIQFKSYVVNPVISAAHIGDMPAIDAALALGAQLRAQIYERHMEMVAEVEETLANVRQDAENAADVVAWTLIVFMAAGIALGLIAAIFTTGLISKVTDKEDETKLRQQQIYDANPIPASLWNAHRQIVVCNTAMVELLDLSDKDDYTERFYEFTPEFQQDGTRTTDKVAEISSETNKNGYCRAAFTHLSAEKEIVPCDVIAVKIELDSEILHAVYVLDLRPMLEATEKLQESEKRTRDLIDACPLGVSLFDEQWKELLSNHTAVDMFGLDENYDYSEPLDFFISEDEGADAGEVYRKVREGVARNGRYRAEILARKLDGTPFPLEAAYVRLDYDDHHVIAAYYRDLTEEKAAKEREREANKAMREKEINERVQVMFDTTPLIIEYWDENYMPVDCNKANLDFFGLTKEQYEQYLEEIRFNPPIPGNIGDSHRSGWDANIKKIFEAGFGRFEWVEPKPDGTNVPLEVEGYRMMFNDEPIVVTYSRDVTALKEAISREQAANSAKRKFLSNMSHEIRTPMSAIIGMAGIAKNTDDIKKKDESILKIDKASKHLLGIINQILDMSKIEAENFELDSHSFAFEKMLDDVVNILSVKVDEKQIALDVTLAQAVPRFIVSDELRLSQVVTNLLGNAIKFTPKGGNVRLVVALETSGSGNNLRVEVSDNGIGIPKEQQDALFDSFVQVESDTTRKYGGTGLGLSISKFIVEKMGGRIWVKSEPDKGSCFIFTIPAVEGRAEEAPKSEMLGDIPPDLFSGYTVLVAEDVEVNREILSALLEPIGIKIECAENGSQALQMFRDASWRYALIFMDVQMPIMDGITATRLIRELGTEKAKSIPIVAMTANVFQEDIKICLDAGMNDHLGKPLDFNQIMEKLRLYLRN